MDVNRWAMVWMLSLALFLPLRPDASAEPSDQPIPRRQVPSDPNPEELFDHDIGDTGSEDRTSGQESADQFRHGQSSMLAMPGQAIKRDVAELDVFPLVHRAVRNSDLELGEEEQEAAQRDEQMAKREAATSYPRRSREEMMGGYIKREIGEGQEWFPPAQESRFASSRTLYGEPYQRQPGGYNYPVQMPYARQYPFAKRNSYERQEWLKTGSRSNQPAPESNQRSKSNLQSGFQGQLQNRGSLPSLTPEEYYRQNAPVYRSYVQPNIRRQMNALNFPYQNELPFANKREDMFPNYGEEFERSGAMGEGEANYEMEAAPEFKSDAQMPYYYYSPQEAYVPRSRRLYDPGGSYAIDRTMSEDTRNEYEPYPQSYPSQQMYGNQYPISYLADDQSEVIGDLGEQYALLEPDASLAKREAQLKKSEAKNSGGKPGMQRMEDTDVDLSSYQMYNKRDMSGYDDRGGLEGEEDVYRQRRGTAYESRRAKAAFGTDQFYRYPVWKRDTLKAPKRVLRYPSQQQQQLDKRSGLRKRVLRNERMAAFADSRRELRGLGRNRDVFSNPQETKPDWAMRNSRRTDIEQPRGELRLNRQPSSAERLYKGPVFDTANRYRLQDKELLNRDTSYQYGNPSSPSRYSDWASDQQGQRGAVVRGFGSEDDSYGRQAVVSRAVSEQEKSRMEWEKAQQTKHLNKNSDNQSKNPGVVKGMKQEKEQRRFLSSSKEKHKKEGEERSGRFKAVSDEDYPAQSLEEELEEEDNKKNKAAYSRKDNQQGKMKNWNIEEREESRKRLKSHDQKDEEEEKPFGKKQYKKPGHHHQETKKNEDFDETEEETYSPEELRGLINKREEPDAMARNPNEIIEGLEEEDTVREEPNLWSDEKEDSGDRKKKNQDPEYTKTYNNYLKKYEEFAKARNQDLDEELDDETPGGSEPGKNLEKSIAQASTGSPPILTSITNKHVLIVLLLLTLAMTSYASSTCFWSRNLA